jgi:hypothetical protein
MEKSKKQYFKFSFKKIFIKIFLLLIFSLMATLPELYAQDATLNRIDSLKYCLNIYEFLMQKTIEIDKGINSYSKEDIEKIIRLNQKLIDFIIFEINYKLFNDPLGKEYDSRFNTFFNSSRALKTSIESISFEPKIAKPKPKITSFRSGRGYQFQIPANCEINCGEEREGFINVFNQNKLISWEGTDNYYGFSFKPFLDLSEIFKIEMKIKGMSDDKNLSAYLVIQDIAINGDANLIYVPIKLTREYDFFDLKPEDFTKLEQDNWSFRSFDWSRTKSIIFHTQFLSELEAKVDLNYLKIFQNNGMNYIFDSRLMEKTEVCGSLVKYTFRPNSPPPPIQPIQNLEPEIQPSKPGSAKATKSETISPVMNFGVVN